MEGDSFSSCKAEKESRLKNMTYEKKYYILLVYFFLNEEIFTAPDQEI